MKSCYRLLLYFLLPAILIGCRSGVSNTSRSQSAVATPTASPDQTKEDSSRIEYPAPTVYRLTMREGDAEFRLVYDWKDKKCMVQWVEKLDPTDLDKEAVETIFTDDDCNGPYVYHLQDYIEPGDHPPLAVISRGLGETCPAIYRIIEFPHDDPDFVVTEAFGNCSPNTTLSFDGKKLTIKIKSQYFHPADVYADPETWVYSNKKLRQIKTKRRRR